MGLGVLAGQRKRAPDNRRSSGALGLRSCRAAAGLACRSNSPHASNGRAGWAEDTTAPGLSPRRQSAVEQGISPVGRLRRERWGSAVARPTPLCHCQEGAARRSHRTGHKSSQVCDRAPATPSFRVAEPRRISAYAMQVATSTPLGSPGAARIATSCRGRQRNGWRYREELQHPLLAMRPVGARHGVPQQLPRASSIPSGPHRQRRPWPESVHMPRAGGRM